MVLVSVVTDTRLPFPCRCRLLLVGHIASPRLLSQLTYAACSHEPEAVLKVDKVLAWTVGERHHAEVDVVLVSRHDIADIWVAFLQVFEQYRCDRTRRRHCALRTTSASGSRCCWRCCLRSREPTCISTGRRITRLSTRERPAGCSRCLAPTKSCLLAPEGDFNRPDSKCSRLSISNSPYQ